MHIIISDRTNTCSTILTSDFRQKYKTVLSDLLGMPLHCGKNKLHEKIGKL